MSNARIQFSLASEDVWLAYNPQLKEGEIVTVLKANKKVKLVQGKVGGSNYSESTVIWDEDEAQAIMSRTEAAAVTATAQAAAASDSASAAADSQATAATFATNAKASENAAKTSETNAKVSETAAKNSATSAASSASTASTQAGKAADSATSAAGSATQAGTFATTATNKAAAANKSAAAADKSAAAADKSESSAKTYMDMTKDLSENVNVFVPSVDADGTLTWTNKAGLANPAAVNIKGEKGDKGDPGPQGPKGDGAITVDKELSATSVNPVQNKIIKVAIDNVADSIPKTSVENTWTAQQTINFLSVYHEKYPIYIVSGTNDTPIISAMMYKATNNFTLDLGALAMKVDKSQISVFSAYFTADADYALTITNCGTVKYIGSASDVAITSSGLLLNIMMVKDASNNLTSIVQASKLS
jgi:hypothetical protein